MNFIKLIKLYQKNLLSEDEKNLLSEDEKKLLKKLENSIKDKKIVEKSFTSSLNKCPVCGK